MKRLTFKICVLMLITSVSMFGQNKLFAHQETVYSEDFSVEKNDTAILNLENTTVAIENSTDGKIHFDYVIEFSSYSKKDIQSFIKDIKVEASQFENNITLNASSIQNISRVAYELETAFGLTLDDNIFGFGKVNDTIYRKSKDSLVNEISSIKIDNSIIKNLKKLNKKGEKEAIDFSKVKMYKSKFVIKIPAYVKVRIIGKQAQITFLDDIANDVSLSLKKGTVKGKLLSNIYNKFTLNQASFKFEHISGGNFSFDEVSVGKIGTLQNARLNSQFSKLEIGEIQDKVTITDYNSEYWFYNWAKDFERFDMYSEYTKLYFFYPEIHDFALTIVGNNTVNHFDNMTVNMQPTKKDEKFKMLERKSKGKGHFSGEIHLDMVRGVLYSANDTFIKSK